MKKQYLFFIVILIIICAQHITAAYLYSSENDSTASGYFTAGQAYYSAGKTDKAKQCFQAAIYYAPESYIAEQAAEILQRINAGEQINISEYNLPEPEPIILSDDIINNISHTDENTAQGILQPYETLKTNIIWLNDFTEESDLNLTDWFNLHGNYQDLNIENGWLYINTSGEYSINSLSSNAVPLILSNYTVETVMKATANSRWGVNYYVNYYQQSSDKAWNIHFLWEAKNQRWEVATGDGGVNIIQYRDDIGMTVGHPYYIKMYIKDNILKIFLDTELIFNIPMKEIFSITGRSYPYFCSGSCGPTAIRYNSNYPAEAWIDYFYVYETP